MSQKIFIGNFPRGQTTNKLPFFIDNNSFPTLFNFYAWRGRAKKKRGTVLLDRLRRQFSSVFNTPNSFVLVADLGNLIIGFGLEANGNIVPGTVSLTVGANVYTDPALDGILVGAPGGSGTINYATGAINIAGGGGAAVTGTFTYYPDLPVMGLEDFNGTDTQFPVLVAFDTRYSYQVKGVNGLYTFYTTNFYKNIPPFAPYPGYAPKATPTPLIWTGQDYQQFWSTNYEQAMWVTNNVPGMQLQSLVSVVRVNATTLTLVVLNSPVVVGDFLWLNEIVGTTSAGTKSINNMAGYVTAVVEAPAGTFTITFVSPNANFLAQAYTGGVVQYLTNLVPGKGDGIRWYDGDPTNATGLPVIPPTIVNRGWVNFAPPLGTGNVQINNLFSGTNPFYLVGALAILPFKDRLLFFSPWITTSADNIAGIPPKQLLDTIIWSWNGTPYYTASYDGNISPQLVTYFPILTAGTTLPPPAYQEGAGPFAYYTDLTGYGGFIQAGINQAIMSVDYNEDVLIIGFTGRQIKMVYTGNDIFPFQLFNINTEFGTSSTFSSVTLDRGVITVGTKGIIQTSQEAASRIDLQIPDEIFHLSNQNNATLRISGARDFQREWVYFSYVPNTPEINFPVFPTMSFFWNYREETWAFFYENFTTHGIFRGTQGGIYTWLTIPWTWETWNESWTSGLATALNPVVIGGNPQGYVLIKGDGTAEAVSGYIYAIAAAGVPLGELTQIQSFNHCVAANNPIGTGDYLLLSGLVGPNASLLNGQIGQVVEVIDINTFIIDLEFPVGAIDYAGNGQYARLTQPLLQTKQFPLFWEEGRKVRLGVQKYLLDKTETGQVTLNMYLSQDPETAWNMSTIIPDVDSSNNSLIYSQILFTCPESSNIGLTEFTESVNNPSPIANTQKQIWHRVNTSLIGDTVQLGITLDDIQMRDVNQAQEEIALHAVVIDVGRGPLLS